MKNLSFALVLALSLSLLGSVNSALAQAVDYTWDDSTQSWSPSLPSTLPFTPHFIVNENDTATLNAVTAGQVYKDGTGTLNMVGTHSLGTAFFANQGTVNFSNTSGVLNAFSIRESTVNFSNNVSIKTGGINVGQMSYGTTPSAFGILNIDGENSLLNVTGVHVKNGEVNLTNGASIISQASLYSNFEIGEFSGEKGIVRVSSGSTLHVNEQIRVGGGATNATDKAAGNLEISGGGKVSAVKEIFVGNLPKGEGKITVSGAGSELSTQSLLSLGHRPDQYVLTSGVGELRVEHGGLVSAEKLYVNNTSKLFAYGGDLTGDLQVDGGLTLGYSSVTDSFGLNVDGKVAFGEKGRISVDFTGFNGWNDLEIKEIGGYYYSDIQLLSWTEPSYNSGDRWNIGFTSSFDFGEDWLFGGYVRGETFSTGDGELYARFQYIGELPSPTPEPATMLILGLGLAGLGFARRRKK